MLLVGVIGCASRPPGPSQLDLGPNVGPGFPDLAGNLPDGSACETINVAAVRQQPNVMIVLDRSGSMFNANTGVDRWTPAVTAINATLASQGDAVAFGLALFGSGVDCGTGDVFVTPGPNTATQISNTLIGDPALLTGGGTPVSAILTEVDRHLRIVHPGEANHVVLITDGAPNCTRGQGARTECVCTFDSCSPGNGDWRGCLDDLVSVETVASLAQAGVPSWVIGYDTGTLEQETLNAMAVAGNTGRTTFIPVGDQTTLGDALAGIATDLVSCSYGLDVVPDDATFVRVQIDGIAIPGVGQGGTGEPGWRLVGNTVELQGAACESLQDGAEHDLVITRECEPVLLE